MLESDYKAWMGASALGMATLYAAVAKAAMGEKARRYVRENFLLTRHLREYLTLMLALERGARDRVEIV